VSVACSRTHGLRAWCQSPDNWPLPNLQVLARYGAGLMALHTRLGLQLRHMLH
jgi:hypothetical protein